MVSTGGVLSTRKCLLEVARFPAESCAVAVTTNSPSGTVLESIDALAVALNGSPSPSTSATQAKSGSGSRSSTARTWTWIVCLTQTSAPGVGGAGVGGVNHSNEGAVRSNPSTHASAANRTGSVLAP